MSLILTLNAGSSSLKFALFRQGETLLRQLHGQVDGLGAQARLDMQVGASPRETREIGALALSEAVAAVFSAITPHLGGQMPNGIGHRIVHGGADIDGPRVLDARLIENLEKFEPLAPLHQPFCLATVRAAMAQFPKARQVGAFDTAFHRGHPKIHDMFAIPRHFYDEGIRSYGFHGLSFRHIIETLQTRAPDIATGKVIVAHLGNGASLCGIENGRSVSSTMGFSALGGLCMGTRPGQLDPGVLLYLMKGGMDAAALSDMLYHESGLKGLSGISNDMRELLASPADNAQEAVNYYISRIKREIGAMAATLGGLDALVFTGGVGQNASVVRERAVKGLEFLGLSLCSELNDANALRIESGEIPIFVLPADEERVIAERTSRFL